MAEIKEQEGWVVVDHNGEMLMNTYSSEEIMSEMAYKEKTMTFRQRMDNKPYRCIPVVITPKDNGSSPDMLEALKEAHFVMKWMWDNMSVTDSNLQSDAFNLPANCLSQIKAAIEKAEGRNK